MAGSPRIEGDVICPSCNGTKETRALSCYANGTSTWAMHPCLMCSGTGEISGALAERIAKGERIRQARIAKYESMHDAAKRLGMSVVDYSQMEHGRLENFDYEKALA